jgi:ABC-type bacteriocin/lantibiotic exporter with double-glycine peptidase domain
MQKFYNISFSYENKKLKEHKCDVSIDFDGAAYVVADNTDFSKHQMVEIDPQQCFIFFNFDKFYILEKYKKNNFKYLVFCIDQEKEKINKNELKDFAFALFSGIILENFEL